MSNIIKKLNLKAYGKIAIVFAIIILGFGLLRLRYEMNRYVKGVRSYQLVNDVIENNKYGFLNNYVDYQTFIHSYGIDEYYSDKDFKKNNYLYYVVSYDECSEKILGVKSLDAYNEFLNVTFELKNSCGECDKNSYVYFIPVKENQVRDDVRFYFDNISLSNCNIDMTYDKPILYLYPQEEMDINVSLGNPELLLTTYPKYNNGWNMHVYPNGDMYDSSGKYYYALYWDERRTNFVSFDEGFYVTKDDALVFLEEKLSLIGLSDKERNEFIMYWLPKLENNEKSVVYFELTDEVDGYQPLLISPKPDSVLRVIIHIKKVNHMVFIKEQKLKPFNRSGYVAVEWGGSVYN